MMREGGILLILGLIPLSSFAFGADAAPPGPISLRGEWSFRIDRDDKGAAERWFAAALPDRISLPGSMAENGLGDPVTIDTKWTGQIVDRSWYTDPKYEKYRQPGNVKVPFWLTPVKYYVGPAWYQRTIEFPESWKGKRITLFLERPHWQTTLWLDEKQIGTQNSLSTPHVYDLGDVAPGSHRITICADNRVKISVGVNAHSVSDHTQTNWNGIVGKIELRASDPVWIDDVQIYPDVAKKSAKVRIAIGNATGQPAKGELVLQAACNSAQRKHQSPAQKVAFSADGPKATVEAEYALGDGALPWSEFTPNVYALSVSLSIDQGGKKFGDARTADFGLREIRANGTQFAMNGQPIFVRGTLECCIFPLTGHPPTDVDSWLRIMRIAKAHGLNTLRFHSWCPPEAAFIAGDRVGMLFQVEGAVWTTVGENPTTDAWLRAECQRIFDAYGNHPSFCMFTHGNEPGGKNQNQFLGELVSSWKKSDGRRVYSAGSGWPMIPENDYHCTPIPRVFAWGSGMACRLNAKPPETTTDYRDFIRSKSVPVVSHEIGQWCVYPNLEEIGKYTGVTRAANFEIFRDTLAANHMLDQARQFLLASGKLQTLCYKEDIESAMRTPAMAGFQLLDLHDFPGQGTALVGVLDPFWDSKGYVTPEEYHRFACETVPLARLAKRIFTSDETLKASIEISHFGAAPIENATLAWSVVTADGRTVAKGNLPTRTIPLGNCTALGNIEVSLADVPAPAKLNLRVELPGTKYGNDWDVWVYPAAKPSTDPGDVLIADRFDDAAKTALSAGRKVMLMPAPGTVVGDRYGKVPPGFTSIFWNTAWTRRQAPHTLGILCDPKHLALASFPTEYHSNWQWWELIGRSQTMILNDMPADLRPIVQVIDDWFTNRRLGLVFEGAVGGGRLLVCGIDLRSDLNRRPVARQMLSSLLKYMNSPAFDPKLKIDEAIITSLLSPASPMRGAKVIKTDSQEPDFPAAQAIDGDPNTIWHTQYRQSQPDYPHEIQIDLGKPVDLAGFRYLPRQDIHNGWASQYEFCISDDGKKWGEPVARGTFEKTADEKRVVFAQAVRARYVRFVAVAGFDGQKFATLAELDLIPVGAK